MYIYKLLIFFCDSKIRGNFNFIESLLTRIFHLSYTLEKIESKKSC